MIKFYTICWLVCCTTFSSAQECTVGLCTNETLRNTDAPKPTKQTRSINLPFFDDFSTANPQPNASKWTDQHVFINNTFGVDMISQGVATFDAMNQFGISYHPNGLPASYKADSLTSQPIVLSGLQAADSIYLSFFVQPQGNGFKPEPLDSLLLFFIDNTGSWSPIWSIGGSPLQPFQQVMIRVADPKFMHANFQFRFINLASPNSNDDVWNIDYVKLAKGRSRNDTVISDVAFTTAPTSILPAYYAMPYRHFKFGLGSNQSSDYNCTINNNYKSSKTLNVNSIIKETTTNTIIQTDNTTITMLPTTTLLANYISFPVNFTTAMSNADVVFQQKYYYSVSSLQEFTGNDTIVHNQLFSNYFAYDDGSAEKAYFLYGLPNVASSTALKFNLNVADTLRGLSIRFANQVPSGANKPFSIVVYKSLGTTTQSQQIIYRQNNCTVQYPNTIDAFSTYRLDTTLALQPGEYFIGTVQEPNVGADSIYFGLDANTKGNIDHFYYNVDGTWKPSLINASTMIRPIVGSNFIPTAVPKISKQSATIIYPNPVNNYLHIQSAQLVHHYIITDYSGKLIQKNVVYNNTIPVYDLPNTLYNLQLFTAQNQLISTTPFTKQ